VFFELEKESKLTLIIIISSSSANIQHAHPLQLSVIIWPLTGGWPYNSRSPQTNPTHCASFRQIRASCRCCFVEASLLRKGHLYQLMSSQNFKIKGDKMIISALTINHLEVATFGIGMITYEMETLCTIRLYLFIECLRN
jgi:hypothetical protein